MPRYFENWSRTYSCVASYHIVAKSEHQVIQAIELARSVRKPLRVVGTGHSPSDIACTSGILLSLDGMNKVLKVDTEQNEITVQAGMKLWELNEVLHKLGWAFPNLGSITEQSIAGAISTATHGTGLNFGNVSTAVVELTMITATGETVVANSHVDATFFSAAVCSLGALGVITRVTLKCSNAFKLKAYQEGVKFDYLMDRFEELAASAEHVRFHWFPLTDDIAIWRASKTTEERNPLQRSWYHDKLCGYYLYEAALYLSAFIPSITPHINRAHCRLEAAKKWPTGPEAGPRHLIDDSFRVFAMECLFRQYVNEWALDRKDAPSALRMLKTMIEEKKWMVHAPVEIRLAQKDDIMLSPATGRDTCYIGVIMYKPYEHTIPYSDYWEGYESIMKSLGGRPHWAKAFKLGPVELARVYPRFTEFVGLVKKMDPEGIFANDYIRRHILGQPATSTLISASKL
ncbi:hypothetical protein SeLEV6574_g02178 [Synchytrium endobioticum]|nr:hypothetical protein SeLEV6574_g02178 [Synchytrium endobioticum]